MVRKKSDRTRRVPSVRSRRAAKTPLRASPESTPRAPSAAVRERPHRNAASSRPGNDLAGALTAIDLPIVLLGVNGLIRGFTPASATLLNLTPSDVGRPIRDVEPNVDVSDLAVLCRRVVETAVPVEREVQDLEGRRYLMRLRPWRGPGNRIEGAVLSFVEVDPLKRSLEHTRRALEQNRSLIEMVNVSLLVLDRELRIRTANRAFYEMFQASPADTEGNSFFDLGGDWGGNAPRLRTELENVRATGKPFSGFQFEIELERVGRKLLRASALAVVLPGDSSSSLMLALEDLSDRRLAEDASRASEARYRRLFETTQEGIWILDAKTGKILDVNPFLAEMLGRPLDELVGRTPWELDIGSTPAASQRRFSNLVREGYAYDPEFEIRTKEGQTLTVEAISSTYLSGNRMVAQSNIRDISDRRRLESELRQVQKLESIGRLAGGIAHDFNNILNIISVHAANVERASAPDQKSTSTDSIQKAVERGAGLVRQLLTFARRGEVQFRATDVNRAIQELAGLVRETFSKKISITLDLASDLPRIQADPSQLHQAILNLCVNARDAMPEGGAIRIGTRSFTPDEPPHRRAKPYVQIEVRDTGQGMSPETRSRLFEPFFTTKGEGGSGLGLAVVYGVVNAHGGYIEVDTETGKGTTFRLNFPVSVGDTESVEEDLEEADPPAPAASETILLVEDEKLLLDPVKSLLEGEGYRIFSAEDGREALEVFSRHHKEITILFADIGLPRLDGWEVFQRIKKKKPAIKAVLASGLVDVEQRRQMTEAGVGAVLRKPYTSREILIALRRVSASEGAFH